MSDDEKINAVLEKDRGVWRADSATRQKQISDIAQSLAKADQETRKKILTELAPALSQLGGDLDGVDIEDRKRIVSDLDEKLGKLLPENQANRLVTDLILDIDEFDFDAKWTGMREEATANLEETLAKVSTIKNPTVGDRVKESFQNTIAQFFPRKPLPSEPSPEEKFRKAQEQKVKDAESALLNLRKEQEKLREDQEAKIAERKVLNLKKIQENLTPEQQFQNTVQDKLRKAQEQKIKDAEREVLNLKKAQEQKVKDVEREAQGRETSLDRLRTQKQTRERLKQVGKNTQKLFNDIATMTVAGYEASIEKLAEAEIGKKLEKISQTVEQAVTDFFKNNIEAYYERQSEKGKLQQVVVRDILNRAKRKAEANRLTDNLSNKLSGNSDNIVA
ncbi:hypothetical protein QT972_24915 [Microcoleus sp. herbarium7]|uniref:hypothetical protein n=1 Tax=Microcoleus sp. herbarium7 TaxID=3055435 RepID=UPI002FD5BD96